MDYITSCYTDALVILAGDFNTLSEQEIVARTALTSIFDEPTLGVNRLDRIYTSEPCYETSKVVVSTIKSGHKAVVAYAGEQKPVYGKKKELRTFRRRSPNQHAKYLKHVTNLNMELQTTDDVQADFDQLYRTMLGLLDQFYPERTIAITSSDPAYVTPAVKALMRRKNRLMRAGRTEEAGSLASRIGASIIHKTRPSYAKLTLSKTRRTCGPKCENSRSHEQGKSQHQMEYLRKFSTSITPASQQTSKKTRPKLPTWFLRTGPAQITSLSTSPSRKNYFY
jgi:predicted ATP-dependent Lon-type protease